MVDKKLKQQRRAVKTRAKIKQLGVPRLCVGRTLKHLYAQIIIAGPKGDQVLASASTLEKSLKSSGAVARNVKSATILGEAIAQRALAAGVKHVAFDRSGFKYHGCVKALAEAARAGGLPF